MIDHCVGVLQKQREERSFQAYLSDGIRIIAEMTGKTAGYDVTMPDLREVLGWTHTADDRTGDEIAEDIIARAGLRFDE